jgi:hypothetical protein
MRKATLIGLLGLLLTVLPFLGIPAIWKLYITVGTGGLLLLLGYLLIRDRVYFDNDLGNGERGNESFVETTESLFK